MSESTVSLIGCRMRWIVCGWPAAAGDPVTGWLALGVGLELGTALAIGAGLPLGAVPMRLLTLEGGLACRLTPPQAASPSARVTRQATTKRGYMARIDSVAIIDWLLGRGWASWVPGRQSPARWSSPFVWSWRRLPGGIDP